PGGSPFHEFAPRRAVDTRHESLRPPGITGAPTVGQFVEIPRSMLGVPDDADAVMVNLTVTQATGYGYLTAFPCGGNPPNTSNVNYNAGVDRANASIMALGQQGSLCVVLSESSAHVIVDVNGWFGGTTGIHFGAGPRRIADSRNGLGGWTGTFAPGETRTLDPAGQLPAGSRVAVLGVTSTASTGAGFITVQPCGGQAEVSNLNFVRGVDITNLAVVPLSDNGTICVTTSERTHIVVDIFGGIGADGLARELSVSGATIFPEITPSQHDYIAYCQSTTANQFSVHVRGMPRTTAMVAFVGGTQVVDTTLTIPANDAIVVRITPTGGAPEEYWIRCVPPDFPTITTTGAGTRPPGWYILANNNEPTDGQFGMILDSAGVPVWYKRGAAGRSPRDLKRLADGSLAWFQTFGPGFGNDPTNGFEHFELDGTSRGLIQTIGVVGALVPTNHHELVQLPNGNFLLTAMLRQPPPADPEPCRLQNATGTFPAETSEHVLRAIVQEVTPAGVLVREWDSAGHIAAAETTVPICFRIAPSTDYLSTLHPNAVDLIPNGSGSADDQLLVSARHADAIYAINFDSGTVDWKLGGTTTADSLDIVGDPLNGPARQHDVRVLPSGNISMFDNRTQFTGAVPPFAVTSGAARYVEYAIDETAGTATMVREIRNPNGFFSGATGSARLQPDGGVVI
ncbi:MAG TPA: aryl-sulfate sulfotransferase, partial [Ilumatobacteraceae bacterium]|nr:aryl-sulfate sulfotransferase [Ilumatobacteraceae bacterium]